MSNWNSRLFFSAWFKKVWGYILAFAQGLWDPDKTVSVKTIDKVTQSTQLAEPQLADATKIPNYKGLIWAAKTQITQLVGPNMGETHHTHTPIPSIMIAKLD